MLSYPLILGTKKCMLCCMLVFSGPKCENHIRGFDKHHRLKEHLVGEKILLSLNTLHLAGTKKLIARYMEPFKVMECIKRTSYRFDLKNRLKQIQKVFHVS